MYRKSLLELFVVMFSDEIILDFSSSYILLEINRSLSQLSVEDIYSFLVKYKIVENKNGISQ